MPSTPEDLITIGSRQQVYLEGFKTNIYNKYEPYLVKMADVIKVKLAGKKLTDFSRKRLEKLLSTVEKDLLSIRNAYNTDEFVPAINELSVYSSKSEIRALNQVVVHDFDLPTPGQLKSAVYTNPMSTSGFAGMVLPEFIEGNTTSSISKIVNEIRLGAIQGATTNQIIKAAIGTQAQNFSDGSLAMDAKNVKMVVRTGLQHVAVQAREATWDQNKDIVKGVEWVSTLDSRTSTQCRSLDGEVFKLNTGPRPPIHPNCRSTTVAQLDDRFNMLDEGATRAARPADGKIHKTSANTSYYEWLKWQPASFQNSVIGPTRGKLLRNGGLTVERFADLQLNNKFQPLTLAEMEELEPLAFEKAKI